jgi:SEC-C motif
LPRAAPGCKIGKTMPDSWRNPAELPLDWMPLRRAADKVRRNDPCPCGSGKKYKRCCEEKDRQREASPYSGMTMQEALADPGRHGDPRIIEKIPEDDLDALRLDSLAPLQLEALVHRTVDLEHFDRAEAALSELASRPAESELRPDDVRAALVRRLLALGQLERVERQLAAVAEPEDPLFRAAAVAVRAKREAGALGDLDQLLSVELDHGPCLFEVSDILHAAGYPALSLALLRATAFEQLADAELDLLADDAGALRKELELEGEDAVVNAHLELLDRIDEDAARPDLVEQKTQQNAELLQRLGATREQLRQLERERAAATPERGHEPSANRDEVQSLKRERERLQAEIREKQEQQRELRRQLRAQRAEKPASPAPAEAEPDEAGEPVPDDAPLRPVRFSDAFYGSLRGVEAKLVLKAQEQATRFAAYEPATWHHAKKLADFDDLYSLRVGIHHRLLLRRNAEGGVEVRELTTREKHDALVMRYRR